MSDRIPKNAAKVGTLFFLPHRCKAGSSHPHPGYMAGWLYRKVPITNKGYKQMLDILSTQGFSDERHNIKV